MKVQGLYQQLCLAHLAIGVAEMRHGIERDQAAVSVLAFHHADGAVAHVKPGKVLKRNASDAAEQAFEQRAVGYDGDARAAFGVLLDVIKRLDQLIGMALVDGRREEARELCNRRLGL